MSRIAKGRSAVCPGISPMPHRFDLSATNLHEHLCVTWRPAANCSTEIEIWETFTKPPSTGGQRLIGPWILKKDLTVL